MDGYGEIWKKLSALDVSRHVEKKGKLSYLSWAWAWGTLMEHYPDAVFYWGGDTTYPDGSVAVAVTVAIGTCERNVWLPVMDNRNNAIQNPNARDISDARMRCLVKCLALFGLGFSLYAGEDLSTPSEPQRVGMSDDSKRALGVAAKERSRELAEAGHHVAYNEIIMEVSKGLGFETPAAMGEGDFPACLTGIKEWAP